PGSTRPRPEAARHASRPDRASPTAAIVLTVSRASVARAPRTRAVEPMDPIVLRDAAMEIARDAGAILLEGYGRTHQPERKGRIDLVTEFDRRSDAFVLSEIRRRFPGHAVLAEESGEHESPHAPVRWLVDPLDGTTNFAHNYPFFAVSVAAEREGVLQAGAVYDPVRDEMFAAAAGAGATLNGKSLHVSNVGRVEDA